jgi:hypothetical protein
VYTVDRLFAAFAERAAQMGHVAANEFADLSFEFGRRIGVLGKLSGPRWSCIHEIVPVIESTLNRLRLLRAFHGGNCDTRIWPLMAEFAAKSGLHLTV